MIYKGSSTMKKMTGFTLIEVMVSMFILAIGILGASALQIKSVNANASAMYRSQAIFLANDIIDRMRRDPDTVHNTSAFDAVSSAGTPPTSSGCSGVSGCTPAQVAAQSVVEWMSYFGEDGILPNSTGTVARISGNIFRVTITWTETDKSMGTSSETSHTIDVQI